MSCITCGYLVTEPIASLGSHHRSRLAMAFEWAREEWKYHDAFKVHDDEISEGFPLVDYKLRRVAGALIAGDYELDRPS
ncbi:MAG: hypothetical protein ACOVS5_07965 [Oligoflexus sp.]